MNRVKLLLELRCCPTNEILESVNPNQECQLFITLPNLMKEALPAVGIPDMLRYHTFTAGAGWAYDYGTADDNNKEMFDYLKGYSPVHNVRPGTKYSATMVTTGDHDDRVVPAHSFKFAAELQDKQAGDKPVIIRIETDAGYGACTPVGKRIEQAADVFGFTLYTMGFGSCLGSLRGRHLRNTT